MSITREQLRAVAESMFAEIDTNKNGSLEKEEVKEFSKKMWCRIKQDKEFDESTFEDNFDSLDKNKDGRVDLNELWDSLIEKAAKGGVLSD